MSGYFRGPGPLRKCRSQIVRKSETIAIRPVGTPKTKDLGRRCRATCTPIAALRPPTPPALNPKVIIFFGDTAFLCEVGTFYSVDISSLY